MATVYPFPLSPSGRHLPNIGLGILLALVPLTAAYTQEELASGLEDCAALSADAERLACYDRLQRGARQADGDSNDIPPADAATVPAQTTIPAERAAAPARTTTPAERPAAPARTTTPAERAAAPARTTTPAERAAAPARTATPAERIEPDTGSVQTAEPAEERPRRPFWRRLRDRLARQGVGTTDTDDSPAVDASPTTQTDEAAAVDDAVSDDGIGVTVVDVRRNLSGFAVFLTENNGTWVQISTRERSYPGTPFTARITGGLMGGRFLTPDSGGIAVRVRGPE